MIFLKRLVKSLYFYFFLVKNPIPFRVLYFIEKTCQYLSVVTNNLLNTSIKYPYFIHKDYILVTPLGKFFIKAHSDYDYPLQPYVEEQHDDYLNIPEGKIFIDIGAHVGIYSIKLLHHNKSKVETYCFEPHPTTYAGLLENIHLNNLDSIIHPINAGLYKETGQIRFTNNNPRSAAVSRIIESWPVEDSIEIDVYAFDDFLVKSNIQPSEVWFIKIDVEWFELSVLQGMSSFLQEVAEIDIVCEILDQEAYKMIFNYLNDYNFTIKAIDSFNYIFSKQV